MKRKGKALNTAFGLDLAGYSTGNSGLARADVTDNGSISVTVYKNHLFAQKKQGYDPIGAHSAIEHEWLYACCKRGKVLVDVPIDMQGLPYPSQVTFTWELTLRPVDVAFRALAPFADRIGAPAARFQYVMNAKQKDLWDMLGTQIYETYPAATLDLLHLDKPLKDTKKGKGDAIFQAGSWNFTEAGRMAERLHLKADEDVHFSLDDLDAAICAITGVANDALLLQGRELAREIQHRIEKKLNKKGPGLDPHLVNTVHSLQPPAGYILLKEWPQKEIHLTQLDLSNEANALSLVSGYDDPL